MNRNDAGMFEAGEDFRFAQQSRGKIPARVRNVKDLQRHAAPEHGIFRKVHGAHAAAGDAIDDAIARRGESGSAVAVCRRKIASSKSQLIRELLPAGREPRAEIFLRCCHLAKPFERNAAESSRRAKAR